MFKPPSCIQAAPHRAAVKYVVKLPMSNLPVINMFLQLHFNKPQILIILLARRLFPSLILVKYDNRILT